MTDDGLRAAVQGAADDSWWSVGVPRRRGGINALLAADAGLADGGGE